MLNGLSFVCSIQGPAGDRARSDAMADRPDLALLSSRGQTCLALGFQGIWSVRSQEGISFQPAKVADRSLRAPYRGDGEMVRRALRLPRRQSPRRPVHRPARQRCRDAQVPRDRRRFFLGRGSSAPHSLARHHHLRAARQRLYPQQSRHPAASAWNLRRIGDRSGDRTHQASGRDRGGADAGA